MPKLYRIINIATRPCLMRGLQKIFFLVIALCFLHGKLMAQQGNVWAFGYHAGLDFNFQPPKVINTAIHYPNYQPTWPVYTSSSISDCRGQLLFYGSDAEIYNRYNKLMPNGHLNGSGGGGIVYIVPFPDDTSKYYYFHQLIGYGVPSPGLFYSIVDMTLDSGRGDVVSASFETRLNKSPNPFTVVKHNNDTDSWIISVVNNDTFYVYPLTAVGIGNPKKLPKLHFACNDGSVLRGNHKGDRVTLAEVRSATNYYDAMQYNFDNKLGVLSKPQLFFDRTPTLNNLKDSIDLWGIEYSPNDSFLYYGAIEIVQNVGWQARIYQAETYSNLGTTAVLLDKSTSLNHQLMGMQLGPDNALYIGFPVDSFLNAIQNPDKKGTACNYKKQALDIRPKALSVYMPNIYAPIRHLKWQVTNNANGCADSIHFTNLSDTIYFKSFKWYFGDGDSSTKYAPWHIYKKQGKYSVLLVGINGCGAKLYYTDSVDIHLPAHAGFKKDTVTYTCQQAKLTLHNTYKDLTQTYIYDYGDGTPQTGSFSHDYTKAGSYTIMQAVSNGQCDDTLRQTVTINIEPKPKAGFTLTTSGQCKPYKLQIKNTSVGAYKYLWQTPAPKGGILSDTSSNAANLSLTTLDTGYHNLTLISANHQGCSDTLISSNAIYISPSPVAAFTLTQIVQCTGIKIAFSNTSKYANGYTWNFGDVSAPDTSKSSIHLYNTNGTYHAVLTASNAYCSDTIGQDIKINTPIVKAGFSSQNLKGCPGLKINFDNQSSYNGQSYKASKSFIGFRWDFGDTGSATNTDTFAVPSHIYNKVGVYTVRLIAISPQGCRDTFLQKKYINVLPYPKAALAVQDSTVLCAAFRYNFKNLSANADSFLWDFGDGSKLIVTNDNAAAHTYKTTGDYKVTITAGNGFCLDSSHINVGIKIRPKPSLDFTSDSDIVCLGKAIHLQNNSTDEDSILWSFGDSSPKDTAQNPVHVYKKPGRYNISLIAKSREGCIISLKQSGFIQVADTFSAHITPAYEEGCAPFTVQFITPTVTKDLTLLYFWDFGDKTSSTAQNPAHVFQRNGIYTYKVKLVVTNKYCSDSAVAEVRVKNLDVTRDTVIMRLATVDNNAYAHVSWQKHPLAKSYQIFRSEDGNKYEPVAYTSDTEFIDHRVNVHGKSYWYKVTGLDACSGTSAISKEATTILLRGKSINEDAFCRLDWNNYEVFHYGLQDYSIVRNNRIVSPVILPYYDDHNFFSEDTASHTYQVIAHERGSDSLKSMSNIITIPLQPRLWIPNAYSPNGDGMNDSFSVRATGLVKYHIAIYNRWGEQVFESTDIHQKWIAKIDMQVQEGVYLYMIQALGGTGDWIYRKGTITVMK